MTPKHLEIDSAYNEFDTNGDGIVSDEELAKAERMLQIENNDKMQDQQRLMAWVAMWSTIVAVTALLTPFISIDRMNSAAAFPEHLSGRSNRYCGRVYGRDSLGKTQGE
jgi:hypothetical protein